METQINPGELALASIGVSAIIKGAVPEIGLGRLREMAAIPRKIERLARAVILGKLSYTPFEHEHSYSTLLDRLSRPLAANEVADLIGKFPGEGSDIATAFSVAAQEALRDLKEIFPVSVYRTFAGPKNLPPNAEKVYAFANRLDVVNDPLRVFPLIATGALLRSQAAIVKQIFPTLSAGITEALYAAANKARADKATYQLPPRAEFGVATWKGDRRVPHRPPTQSAPAASAAPSPMPALERTAAQRATDPSGGGRGSPHSAEAPR